MSEVSSREKAGLVTRVARTAGRCRRAGDTAANIFTLNLYIFPLNLTVGRRHF